MSPIPSSGLDAAENRKDCKHARVRNDVTGWSAFNVGFVIARQGGSASSTRLIGCRHGPKVCALSN
jgi:hypothetical protein